MILSTFIQRLAESEVLFVLFCIFLTFFFHCLVYGLACLRTGVPFKDFIKSDEIREKVRTARGLLLYKRGPNGREHVSWEVYAETALTILIPGACWGWVFRGAFDGEMPFWCGCFVVEVLTFLSIEMNRWESRSVHLVLLSLPAALLGGLIACI